MTVERRKRVSPRVKATLAAAGVAGLLLWLMAVDFGINAGLVHSGVGVAGYDVGGMTLIEAQDVLSDRRTLLRNQPICFAGDGFEDCTDPIELGWAPDILETAERALAVGRSGGLIEVLADRVSAYVGGVNVSWSSGPRASKVTVLLDAWDSRLSTKGQLIDRAKFRYKIKRAIVTYPRSNPLRLPLQE